MKLNKTKVRYILRQNHTGVATEEIAQEQQIQRSSWKEQYQADIGQSKASTDKRKAGKVFWRI